MMKKCPFCAEEIQDEAIVCRYCGRELKTKVLRYRTFILHFRNPDEAGWLWADDQPVALITQHLFNQLYAMISEWDTSLSNSGWEVAEPRNPGCLQLQQTRNDTQAVLSTISILGGGRGSGQIWKVWPSTCTLRYKKYAEESKQETWNYWRNLKTNQWERMEQDPASKKWFIWRRPTDFDYNNPKDDRWDKIPI